MLNYIKRVILLDNTKEKGVGILQNARSLYGQEILEIGDLVESEIDYLVELAYYKIIQQYKKTNRYAVEVVKTEHLQNMIKVEKETVNLFTDNETKTNHILELLKKNKVTPTGLKDTIVELIKSEAF